MRLPLLRRQKSTDIETLTKKNIIYEYIFAVSFVQVGQLYWEEQYLFPTEGPEKPLRHVGLRGQTLEGPKGA